MLLPKDYAIVIPNRYPELCQRLLESIQKLESDPPPISIIADGHSHKFSTELEYELTDAKSIFDYDTFCFAKNVNTGMRMHKDRNIILLNDDCVQCEKDYFKSLHETAKEYDSIGILGTLVDGGIGNPYQSYQRVNQFWPNGNDVLGSVEFPVCFVSVYIKRALINDIGYLDEGFVGYGFDDNDYCERSRKAGWHTAITRNLVIKHGNGTTQGNVLGESFSLSYGRDANVGSKARYNQYYYEQKHNRISKGA